MRRSALFSGILYILLGSLFTFFAIQSLNENNGWGFFTIVLVLLATFDVATGIRLIAFHFYVKKNTNTNKK